MPVPTGTGDGSDDLRIAKTGRAKESIILSCGCWWGKDIPD